MKIRLTAGLIFLSSVLDAQNTALPEKYQCLPFGSIKPSGWLKTQMQMDFSGGVAHGLTFTDVLDRLFQLTGTTEIRTMLPSYI